MIFPTHVMTPGKTTSLLSGNCSTHSFIYSSINLGIYIHHRERKGITTFAPGKRGLLAPPCPPPKKKETVAENFKACLCTFQQERNIWDHPHFAVRSSFRSAIIQFWLPLNVRELRGCGWRGVLLTAARKAALFCSEDIWRLCRLHRLSAALDLCIGCSGSQHFHSWIDLTWILST